jgi:proteasome accessory factor C
VERYALFNGNPEAWWYVAAFDLDKDKLRHFRLDRIKEVVVLDEHFERREDLDPIADIGGWPKTGTVEGSRVARVWISPEQARWAREKRTVVAELEDGAVVVELPFKGTDYLVKEILKEAGDAAVLEPADAREAVLAAAERLLALSP